MEKILESQSTLEITCSINGVERVKWQKEVLFRWQVPMPPGFRELSQTVFTEETLELLEGINISDVISFEVRNLSREQLFEIKPFTIEGHVEGVNIQEVSKEDIAYLAMRELQRRLETLSHTVQL